MPFVAVWAGGAFGALWGEDGLGQGSPCQCGVLVSDGPDVRGGVAGTETGGRRRSLRKRGELPAPVG